eukprot:5675026-Pleurochrysis_carterae.AAC.1
MSTYSIFVCVLLLYTARPPLANCVARVRIRYLVYVDWLHTPAPSGRERSGHCHRTLGVVGTGTAKA